MQALFLLLMTEKEKLKKQIKNGARDSKGVRVNNYNKTMNGRAGVSADPDNPDEVLVLLNEIDMGLFDPVETEAGTVERRKGSHPNGLPPRYPTLESFRDKVREYFEHIRDTYTRSGVELLPDVEGLCTYCHISRVTLLEWENSKPLEWVSFIKEVKNAIAGYKKQKGLRGKIPPIVMALDFNNNHGYVQRQNVEIQHKISVAELPTVEEMQDKLPE